jgi:hypothetical protein
MFISYFTTKIQCIQRKTEHVQNVLQKIKIFTPDITYKFENIQDIGTWRIRLDSYQLYLFDYILGTNIDMWNTSAVNKT